MAAACVDPSPFGIVLVHSQSRFFRDTAGYAISKRKLQKHDVTPISMTQTFGEGSTADFTEAVMAAADQYSGTENAKRDADHAGERPPRLLEKSVLRLAEKVPAE